MDWLLFSLFAIIFLWLIVLSVVQFRLWSQNGKRHTEIMLLEAMVRPKSPRGNPIKVKVNPLLREEPPVTLDLKQLEDEGIL